MMLNPYAQQLEGLGQMPELVGDYGGGSSAGGDSWLSSLIEGGFDIAKRIFTPPGYIKTPGMEARTQPGQEFPSPPVTGRQADVRVSPGAGLAVAAVVGVIAIVLIARR